MAIARAIYQHAHGPRTVKHLGSKIKGAVRAGVLPTHRSGPWGPRSTQVRVPGRDGL